MLQEVIPVGTAIELGHAFSDDGSITARPKCILEGVVTIQGVHTDTATQIPNINK